VVLTLKLNDWKLAAEIDALIAEVRGLGVDEPQARQLASHRREIAVAGLMRTKKPGH
jgi:hypothetical protein